MLLRKELVTSSKCLMPKVLPFIVYRSGFNQLKVLFGATIESGSLIVRGLGGKATICLPQNDCRDKCFERGPIMLKLVFPQFYNTPDHSYSSRLRDISIRKLFSLSIETLQNLS